MLHAVDSRRWAGSSASSASLPPAPAGPAPALASPLPNEPVCDLAQVLPPPGLDNSVTLMYPDAVAPVCSVIEHALRTLQSASGLPWWATLFVSALLVKLALLPVALQGMRAIDRARLLPPYWAPVRRHLVGTPGLNRSDRLRIRLVAARAILHRTGFSPLLVVANPLLQLSAWLMLALTCRTFLDGDPAALVGGFGPWLNLRATDSVLPALTAGLMLVNMELAVGQGQERLKQAHVPSVRRVLANTLLVLPVIALPFLMYAPVGVCFYILPSSLFALVQTLALRRAAVRARLGLPPLPAPPPAPPVLVSPPVTAAAQHAAAQRPL